MPTIIVGPTFMREKILELMDYRIKLYKDLKYSNYQSGSYSEVPDIIIDELNKIKKLIEKGDIG